MKFKTLRVGEQCYNAAGHTFIKTSDGIENNTICLYGWEAGHPATFHPEDEVGLLRVAPYPIPMEKR